MGILANARRFLNTDVRDLFKSEGRLIDDALLESVADLLRVARVDTAMVQHATELLRAEFYGRVVLQEDFIRKLTATLSSAQKPDV